MRSKGGYATIKELKEAGIHTRKVRAVPEKEFIIKIKPDLYKLRYHQQDEYESFLDIHMANDSVVICLASALAYHELTMSNPQE